MRPQDRICLSKLLSLVLRHRPERLGLTLLEGGWTEVARLLDALRGAGWVVSAEDLAEVVARCEKQRFALSEDGSRIRASQGHSVEVDLGYAPATPPEVLFHGTVERSIAAIRREGLQRMRRHHVHLSADPETARRVGARRGAAVVLRIRAAAMARDGFRFFRSANGVWLVDAVPAVYLASDAAPRS